MEETLLDVHWRLARVTIEHLDVCDCIRRYDRLETVFYIDPPYYKLSQAYAAKFTEEDFARLRSVLGTVKGRFILSLNDHPDVRRIFAPFNMTKVVLGYSVGNSRTAEGTRSKPRNELFIQNF